MGAHLREQTQEHTRAQNKHTQTSTQATADKHTHKLQQTSSTQWQDNRFRTA